MGSVQSSRMGGDFTQNLPQHPERCGYFGIESSTSWGNRKLPTQGSLLPCVKRGSCNMLQSIYLSAYASQTSMLIYRCLSHHVCGFTFEPQWLAGTYGFAWKQDSPFKSHWPNAPILHFGYITWYPIAFSLHFLPTSVGLISLCCIYYCSTSICIP